MEIPLIARISEFAASSSSNVIHGHRLLTLIELPSNGFWKWGALLLALIYAFSRVARVIIKIFILRLHRKTAEFSSTSAPVLGDDGEFFTSDGEDGDSEGSSCSSEDESEMRDDPASISYENLAGFYEDFRVKGGSENSYDRSTIGKRKFKIRRKRSLGGNMFSLCDVVSGKSVVKLWDGLELGLGFDGSSVSIVDLERSVKIGSFPGQIPAVSASSAVVFTASSGCDKKVGLSSWDVRVRRRTPSAKAEWSLTAARPVVRLKAGGVDKVYVRDDVTGNGSVWDVRSAKSPLENVTEYDGEMG